MAGQRECLERGLMTSEKQVSRLKAAHLLHRRRRGQDLESSLSGFQQESEQEKSSDMGYRPEARTRSSQLMSKKSITFIIAFLLLRI